MKELFWPLCIAMVLSTVAYFCERLKSKRLERFIEVNLPVIFGCCGRRSCAHDWGRHCGCGLGGCTKQHEPAADIMTHESER